MHSVYIVPFVVSLAMIPIQLHYYKKHISVYYIALFFSMLFSHLGCMIVSYSTTIESAYVGLLIDYFGSVYTPFFSFLCVADLTKSKVSMTLKSFCFTVSTFIFLLVLIIPFTNFYYKSMDIYTWRGITCISKVYGPLHTLYPLYLAFLIILSISLLVIAITKKDQVSSVTCTSLIILLAFSFSVYIIERLLKSQIDFIPISQNIEQIGLILLLNRINSYDISSITSETMIKDNRYGFISFKAGAVYIGSEGLAAIWFPEINDLQMDKPLPKEMLEKSDLLRQISDWINSSNGDDSTYIERDGKIFEVKYSVVYEHGRKRHILIVIRDDTVQQRMTKIIKGYSENLEEMITAKTEKLQKMQDDIILGMASTVEIGDLNTGGHIKRTSDVMRVIVPELMKTGKFPELTTRVSECLIKAAPLHDFGKVCVPDVVLNKPGKYTDEEYEIMKTHSEKGAVVVGQILQNADNELFKKIAVNVAHYHHEKWNGTGYPAKLKGTEIPFEARVMALADVFDALVSKRVYKEQLSYDVAFKIIEESCGEHFDPELCKEFLKCRPLLEQLYNSY